MTGVSNSTKKHLLPSSSSDQLNDKCRQGQREPDSTIASTKLKTELHQQIVTATSSRQKLSSSETSSDSAISSSSSARSSASDEPTHSAPSSINGDLIENDKTFDASDENECENDNHQSEPLALQIAPTSHSNETLKRHDLVGGREKTISQRLHTQQQQQPNYNHQQFTTNYALNYNPVSPNNCSALYTTPGVYHHQLVPPLNSHYVLPTTALYQQPAIYTALANSPYQHHYQYQFVHRPPFPLDHYETAASFQYAPLHANGTHLLTSTPAIYYFHHQLQPQPIVNYQSCHSATNLDAIKVDDQNEQSVAISKKEELVKASSRLSSMAADDDDGKISVDIGQRQNRQQQQRQQQQWRCCNTSENYGSSTSLENRFETGCDQVRSRSEVSANHQLVSTLIGDEKRGESSLEDSCCGTPTNLDQEIPYRPDQQCCRQASETNTDLFSKPKIASTSTQTPGSIISSPTVEDNLNKSRNHNEELAKNVHHQHDEQISSEGTSKPDNCANHIDRSPTKNHPKRALNLQQALNCPSRGSHEQAHSRHHLDSVPAVGQLPHVNHYSSIPLTDSQHHLATCYNHDQVHENNGAYYHFSPVTSPVTRSSGRNFMNLPINHYHHTASSLAQAQHYHQPHLMTYFYPPTTTPSTLVRPQVVPHHQSVSQQRLIHHGSDLSFGQAPILWGVPPTATPLEGYYAAQQQQNRYPAAMLVQNEQMNQSQGQMSAQTGFIQLKSSYNLTPLLPIDAQPTRTRQAYGMDKVWQDEFEQLFSQFVSDIIWNLVEVETNPSIRDNDSIIGYKGRYIVRASGLTNSDKLNDDLVTSESSEILVDVQVNDQAVQLSWEETGTRPGSDDDDDDGDGESVSVDCDDKNISVNQADDTNPSGNREPESDCDSGAIVNSTSDCDVTRDESTPDSVSPSKNDSNQQVEPISEQTTKTSTESATTTGHKFPTRFRMFIDSAKVRFCCDNCGHGWTSMKGRVVFWYELFELVHEGENAGSDLVGYCAYKLFGQQCDMCKIENRFERPMWYPEEVTKVLNNLYNKIGQVYFGFRMPAIDKQRRSGKPKTSHNSSLCQACHDGVCTDRK